MVISEGSKRKSVMVSTSELGELLGVTDRRIRQLDEAGVFSKVARGKYDLGQAVQAYVSWVRQQAEVSLEKLNLTEEQALLTRTKRQIAELELQIMQGELHRAEDVERVMNQMLGAFRARCLTIPAKTAPLLVGKNDLAEIQNILKRDIYEALHELADYDPGVFYKASRDKIAVKASEKEIKPPPAKGKPRQNASSKAM